MENQFKEIAALIGDPVRATIMWKLLDGRAFTATELAMTAGTSASNLSMHLAKLLQAGLLVAENQGRHRYYSFARREIAYAIEAMTHLVPSAKQQPATDDDVPAIKQCRTCYDHIAGKTGVAITDSLLQQKLIIANKRDFTLSVKGEKWFTTMGINTAELRQQRRSFLRPCLDWSERRYHMAGSLPAALLDTMLLQDWIRRVKNSRAVVVTAKGEKNLYTYLKLRV